MAFCSSRLQQKYIFTVFSQSYYCKRKKKLLFFHFNCALPLNVGTDSHSPKGLPELVWSNFRVFCFCARKIEKGPKNISVKKIGASDLAIRPNEASIRAHQAVLVRPYCRSTVRFHGKLKEKPSSKNHVPPIKPLHKPTALHPSIKNCHWGVLSDIVILHVYNQQRINLVILLY